mgnify:CR=1 FL=1
MSSYMQFGCCAEFINLYREKLATAPDNTVCNIMGKDIACDKEVYVALTALGVEFMRSAHLYSSLDVSTVPCFSFMASNTIGSIAIILSFLLLGVTSMTVQYRLQHSNIYDGHDEGTTQAQVQSAKGA